VSTDRHAVRGYERDPAGGESRRSGYSGIKQLTATARWERLVELAWQQTEAASRRAPAMLQRRGYGRRRTRSCSQGQSGAPQDGRGYNVIAGRPGALDVLVLGANLRQGLTAMRSLGRGGLRVGAADRTLEGLVPAFASRWCQVGLGLPDVITDEEAFTNALIAVLEDCPTVVVLPVDDSYLHVLNRNRADIERRTILALPPAPALSLLDNKSETLALATSLGIPVPEGIIVEDVSDADAASRLVGFPAVVKPSDSWPDLPIEQRGDSARLFCHAARDSAELVSAVSDMLASGGIPIVQPWLPGAREAVSVFVVSGKVYAMFAQIAYRMLPPLGGSSIYRESIPPPEDIADAAEALALAAGLEGYAEVEFRRDASGRAVLMEVNPRLSASVEIAVRAGVDFPLMSVRHAARQPLPPSRGYRAGMRMRWLGGDLQWLCRSITDRRAPDVPGFWSGLGELVMATVRPTGYDYVDRRDPWPAAIASQRLMKETVVKLGSSVGRARRM
jgi:predicted ATP-grasp superfamily ATP-dependent carboligase